MLDFLAPIETFFSSNASTSIVATVAALSAYIIYSMRKRDHKKDAANIVLLEISSAEKNIEEAKKMFEQGKIDNPEAIRFPEKLRLMPTASWLKYKYLFVRDLSKEQWDAINKFYDNCTAYDEAVEIRDSSFLLNAAEIRVNVHRIVSKYAGELVEGLDLNETNDPVVTAKNEKFFEMIQDRKKATVKALMRQLVEEYTPDKPFKDAAYFFSLLPQDFLNTPTGDRLRVLADRRFIRLKKKSI